jgi:inosine/xanthosine triphosphatase
MIPAQTVAHSCLKVKAVESALKQCFPSTTFALQPVHAASGVPDQPIGCEQTLQGAINRVRNASMLHTDSSLTVAIEGGVEWLGPELHCFAWAAVQSNATGAISKARSATFMLPDKIVKLVQQGMELGEADDRVFGRTNSGQGSGTVGKLSGGLITRAAYYEHAVVLALLPFMNQELYPEYVMQQQQQQQQGSG